MERASSSTPDPLAKTLSSNESAPTLPPDAATANTVSPALDDTMLPASPALDDTLSASSHSAATLQSTTLGHVSREVYRTGREIARGGMGRIVLATDLRLDRAVAIKEMLHPQGAGQARFEREARLTAKLQHPAIIPVYEAGSWSDGVPFFAMKHVEGRSLDVAVESARTLDARVGLLSHVIDACEAIAFAHARGVIHRDLKPANVLVGSFGETVVIDWGIAKDTNAVGIPDDVSPAAYRTANAHPHTVEGAIMGTPAYMAPEQARGEAIDARADVYALGAMLYHVLSGAPPYDAPHVVALLAKVLEGPPTPLTTVEPRVMPELAAIVQHAMERDPAKRYPDASAMAADLRRYQTGQLVGAHRYSTRDLVMRWVKRNRVGVGIAAAALATVAAVGTVSIQRVIAARNQAIAERTAAERSRKNAEQSRELAEQAQEKERRARDAAERENAVALGVTADALARQPRKEMAALIAGIRAVTARSEPPAEAMRGLVSALANPFRTGASMLPNTSPDGTRWVDEHGAMRRKSDKALLFTLVPAPTNDCGTFTANGDAYVGFSTRASSGVVWNANNGTFLRKLQGSSGDHNSCFSASPDGRLVGGGSPASVWSVETGAPVIETSLTTSSTPFEERPVSFSRDSRRASVGPVVYDLVERKVIATLASSNTSLSTISPDGTHVALRSPSLAVSVYSVTSDTPPLALVPCDDQTRMMAFSEDTTQLFVECDNGLVSAHDARTGARLMAFGMDGAIGVDAQTFAFDTRGELHTNTTRWNVRDGQATETFALPGRSLPLGLTFRDGVPPESESSELYIATARVKQTPRGDRLLTMSADGSTPEVWDTHPATLRHAFTAPESMLHRAAAISDDGSLIAFDISNEAVAVFDAISGAKRATLTSGCPASALSFSRDGQQLYVGIGRSETCTRTGDIDVWNIAKETVLHRLTLAGNALSNGPALFALEEQADGTLVSFHLSGIALWDLKRGAVVRALAHDFVGFEVGVSAGRVITKLGVADLATGQIAGKWNGPGQPIALSRDGKFVAYVSSQPTPSIRISEVETQREVAVLTGSQSDFSTVAFSPDGTLVAGTGSDLAVHVWSLPDGQRVGTYLGRSTKVKSLGFTPDGRGLLVQDHSNLTRMFPVRPSGLVRLACSRLQPFPELYREVEQSCAAVARNE